MSEPTIDELLTWMNAEVGHSSTRENYAAYQSGIRGVLEHYRECHRRSDIEIIRAFVERVEAEYNRTRPYANFWNVMRDELAAMEKENNPE